MVQLSSDEVDWLTGPAAAAALDRLRGADTTKLDVVTSLRRDFSAARAHLLLQQAELRRRGAKKFHQAASMFFTEQGLEQASDETIAAYKAERFPAAAHLMDCCCGIGGDLMALARRGYARGMDLDPACARFAAINCGVLGAPARVDCKDAAEADLANGDAWHIDPDRRPGGRRTSSVLHSFPSVEAIDGLLKRCGNAAIKLAPAADAPRQWAAAGEREWISRDGECKQQVVWLGGLARHAGRRFATILRSGRRRTVVQADRPKVEAAESIGRFIYDPDAALLAARLTDSLASELTLRLVDASSSYLTGDALVSDLALAAFEVMEVLPFQVRRLRELQRQRGLGPLEIKKRGVKLDSEALRKELDHADGPGATLLVTRFQQRQNMVLCRRVTTTEAVASDPTAQQKSPAP